MNINFLQKTFSSLRHENFRLFFTGQSVSLLGTWMQQTALSWLIYDITGSKFLLGLVAALATLPMLFLSVFGGVLADRYSKRNILIITQMFSMVLSLTLALLVSFNCIEVWHIILISTLSGVSFAIEMPVRQSFFVDMAGQEDLMNAIAMNSTLINFARIFGPALAGIVMSKLGIKWCFILNCLSFIAVLLALFKMHLPQIQTTKIKESIWQYTIDGFVYVKNNKTILYLLILMTIVGVFGWSYGILFPVIAKDIFNTGVQGYSALVSANGAGALIGALFIAYVGNSTLKRFYVNAGLILFGIAVLMLAFCKIYWLSLVLISLSGIGMIIYYNASTTLIQSIVDNSVRGRVMGIWSLIFGGTGPVGSIFVGAAAQYTSISDTLIISALVCITSVVILSIFFQNKDFEDKKEPIQT